MKRVLFALAPIILVGLGYGVSRLFTEENPATSKLVTSGGDYYIGVKLVEVSPKKADGSAWDSGSAPDLFFRLEWQGLTIFESSVKSDTLIAHWSEAEFDLREIALEGKKASLDEIIAGGKIRVDAQKPLSIILVESDLVGSDEIGRVELQVTELKLGLQTLIKPIPGVERLVIRVVALESLPKFMGS